MTLSPYRRDRRHLSRRSDSTQQLIVFRLYQEWFALPIRAAYRVIPVGQIYGIQQGVSLSRYQDRDVTVVDIKQRIFGRTVGGDRPLLVESKQPDSAAAPQGEDPQRYLLLLQSAEGQLIGIPLDEFPLLRRVPQSAFTPIPRMYLAESGVRCVSALVTLPDDAPPMFLLNLNQLIDGQPELPSQPTS